MKNGVTAEELKPGFKKTTLTPIKGKRSVKITSLIKTEAAPEDICTVSIPALNRSIVEVFKDLWRSEEDRDDKQEFGLANENVRKLVSKDNSGNKATKTDGFWISPSQRYATG